MKKYRVTIDWDDDRICTYLVEAPSPIEAEKIAVRHLANVITVCANDDVEEWDEDDFDAQLRHGRDGLIEGDPVFTPTEDLADAWRRYQAGEDISPADLRRLDEERADWREDQLGC